MDASFVGQSNICAACLERRRQRCSCLVALVGDVSKAFEIFIYASWFGMPMVGQTSCNVARSCQVSSTLMLHFICI